jgi:hypothetical protein
MGLLIDLVTDRRGHPTLSILAAPLKSFPFVEDQNLPLLRQFQGGPKAGYPTSQYKKVCDDTWSSPLQ